MFDRTPRTIALAIALSFAIAACSTPYGGPGGCLVVGKGNCTTDGNSGK